LVETEEHIMPSNRARALFAIPFVAASSIAIAQDYPTRPVRILTSSPGGGNDFLARIVAPALGTALDQQVVVDNRTSRLVGGLAARATPDGYTLAIGGGTMQYNPITEDADYNILTDFVPISQLERAPLVLVVHPSLKVATVKDLIAVARTRTLRYGTGSAGNTIHIAGVMFAQATGVKINRIPYKSTGPALVALLANEVQMVFSTTGGAIPHVKEGRLTALGVTSAQPSSLLPGVPTLASQGLTEYDIDTIGFILAPSRTPAPIVQRLNQAIVKIMAQPDVKAKLAAGGSEAVSSTPEQLAAKLKADDAWMRAMLVKVGVKKAS
jgi:tripartite-type tricarboxylate transporter receptor subunit TctC